MSTWHASPEDLASYRSGTSVPPVAASLDAHLLRCEQCRRSLAAIDVPGAAADTERRWQAVATAIDGSRGSAQPLLRVGVSSRPLAAALTFAVTLLVVVPLVAASLSGRSLSTTLLVGAPLAPMVAVALSYRRETDPVGELALAAPLAGIRLVSRRALLVAVVSAPVGVGAALALGIPLGVALAWLLPGLALAAVVLLAGTTRLDPTVVTACLGSVWAVGVSLAAWRDGAAEVTRIVTGLPTQTLSLLVAVLALALFAGRRDRLSYRRFL